MKLNQLWTASGIELEVVESSRLIIQLGQKVARNRCLVTANLAADMFADTPFINKIVKSMFPKHEMDTTKISSLVVLLTQADAELQVNVSERHSAHVLEENVSLRRIEL